MTKIAKMWRERGLKAFTLIELLAVIAIIGLLSALVLGLAGRATGASHASRIRSEHGKLITAIESYKAEVGTYPPDNTNSTKWPDYYDRVKRNTLFYELSGAIFTNGNFLTLSRNEEIKPAVLDQEFGVQGIQNSARRVVEVPYRQFTSRGEQAKDIQTATAGVDVKVLVVPVRGHDKTELLSKDGKTRLNVWLYDASSTNRHNPETFDLWTEYLGKKQTNVQGNWKE